MNSRDAAYDEDEQLRRAIEASKEDAPLEQGELGSRRPKRGRSDSEEYVIPPVKDQDHLGLTFRLFSLLIGTSLASNDNGPALRHPHLLGNPPRSKTTRKTKKRIGTDCRPRSHAALEPTGRSLSEKSEKDNVPRAQINERAVQIVGRRRVCSNKTVFRRSLSTLT